MLENLVEFLSAQIILVPVLVYSLWCKYKTGTFFPQDNVKVETPALVWLLGFSMSVLTSALAFWFSLKIYGFVLAIISIACIFGLGRSLIGKNL